MAEDDKKPWSRSLFLQTSFISSYLIVYSISCNIILYLFIIIDPCGWQCSVYLNWSESENINVKIYLISSTNLNRRFGFQLSYHSKLFSNISSKVTVVTHIDSYHAGFRRCQIIIEYHSIPWVADRRTSGFLDSIKPVQTSCSSLWCSHLSLQWRRLSNPWLGTSMQLARLLVIIMPLMN